MKKITMTDLMKTKGVRLLLGVFLILVVAPILIAIEFDTSRMLIPLAILMVAFLVNKFTHEACHYVVGRILGFKCKIKIRLFLPYCKIEGEQSYRQVILTAMAPLLFYIPVSIPVFASSMMLPYKIVFLSVLFYWLSTMVGDYAYVYYALTNKGAKFQDEGDALIIYQ